MGNRILDYACEQFESRNYCEALEAFVLAYMKGYEPEWVIENIYNCYVACNEPEFRNAYGKCGAEVSYEDCVLDFMPYKEGEYYIFDKERKQFIGKFLVSELKMVSSEEALNEIEFGAVAEAFHWNLKEEYQLLAAAKDKKVYAVCHEINYISSFYKIPELEEYNKNVKLFQDFSQFQQYFHKNTGVYLPRILSGDLESVKELNEIVEAEHQFRLTPEGRNTDHVLLTIGIPSRNRGNLLLKRLENLRNIKLDAEIEIAISKNGVDFYQEEYDQVNQAQDSRICYYDHHKDLVAPENWHFVVEMAHGKFVLLVSDEDDIILDSLGHYLKLITEYPQASVIRAKSCIFYSRLSERLYAEGTDALKKGFLKQNYLSGLIFNREKFLKQNLLRLEKFREENLYYCLYPHEWWCAILSKNGVYMEEPFLLVQERESVIQEENSKYIEKGVIEEGEHIAKGTSLPAYSTYESRLQQFLGMMEFVRWIADGDKELAFFCVASCISKILFLLLLARERGYEVSNFMNIVDKFCKMSIEAIREFDFSEEQQVKLLSILKTSAIETYGQEREIFEKEQNAG